MQLKINVLPPERKELVRRREEFVFLLVQCVQISMMMLLVLVMFYGIRLALQFEVENSKLESSQSQERKIAEQMSAYQDEIGQTNRRVIEIVRMEQEHVYWSRLLRKLEALLPEGTYLSQIGTNEYRVSLAGQARDRDVLLSFRDRLSGDDCFSDVEVPLSNLFVQENIDFQVDVTVKPECLKGQTL